MERMQAVSRLTARGSKVTARARRSFRLKADQTDELELEVDTSADAPDCEYELAFHTGAYFDAHGPAETARPIRSLVFRVKLPADDGKFHIPVIAAPHGYSVWWSN